MASDSHDYQMYSPDEGCAVVIGLSQAHHAGDTSLVYCLEVLENREVSGFPFRLLNEHERYIWKNEQIRGERIIQGSVITFNRKCYIENTGEILVSNGVYMDCRNV